MFVTDKVLECLKTLIGWKNHYDTDEIPALEPELNESVSGQYYQSFHPALRLDIIKSTIPQNRTLNSYLEDKVTDGITDVMNTLVIEKGYKEYAKKVLANDIILDKYGWARDKIMNESRFVGFRIKMNLEIGLQMIIKNIGFQFSLPQTNLPIYIYHSSKIEPIQILTINTTNGIEWSWLEQEIKLVTDSIDINGGFYFIGYYQDDIAGEAINYTDFDWSVGPSSCGSCNTNSQRRVNFWRNLSKFMEIMPIYVPSGQYIVGQMFDARDSIEVFSKSWGMNFKISAECDLSDFFCSNKMTLVQTIGLKVAWDVLNDIKFSQQINYIEENLKHMIIRDLEGDVDTKSINLHDKYLKALNAVQFEHSKKSAHCLPCTSDKGAHYGVA